MTGHDVRVEFWSMAGEVLEVTSTSITKIHGGGGATPVGGVLMSLALLVARKFWKH